MDRMVAWAMGQHKRLGDGKAVNTLSPDMMKLVASFVKHCIKDVFEKMRVHFFEEYRHFGLGECENLSPTCFRVTTLPIITDNEVQEAVKYSCTILLINGNQLSMQWGLIDYDTRKDGMTDTEIKDLVASIAVKLLTTVPIITAVQRIVDNLRNNVVRLHPNWKILYEDEDDYTSDGDEYTPNGNEFPNVYLANTILGTRMTVCVERYDRHHICASFHYFHKDRMFLNKPQRRGHICEADLTVLMDDTTEFLDTNFRLFLKEHAILEWIKTSCPGWRVSGIDDPRKHYVELSILCDYYHSENDESDDDGSIGLIIVHQAQIEVFIFTERDSCPPIQFSREVESVLKPYIMKAHENLKMVCADPQNTSTYLRGYPIRRP